VGGAFGSNAREEIFLQFVVGKPTEGPRYRSEDNTKTDLEEVGWEVVD
jgi:hypothetical protein